MQTLLEADHADSPRYLRWEPAEKPVVIDLSLDAAGHMMTDAVTGLTRIPRRGMEVGGILLGTAFKKGDSLIVVVEDFVAVPCDYAFGPSYTLSEESRKAFRAALERSRVGGPPRPIGYYRTETHDNLRLRPQDLDLLSVCFPGPADVALLIRPRTIRASTGAFFFWEDGHMRPESYLEFPVPRQKKRDHRTAAPADPADSPRAPDQAKPLESKMPLLASAAKRPVAQQPVAQPSEPPPAIPLTTFPGVPTPERKKSLWSRLWRKKPGPERPRLETPEPPPRRGNPWWVTWWMQGPLIVALFAAVAVLGYLTAREFHVPLIGGPKAPRDPYALALIVLESGDSLHLTWDKDAPAIASAQSGLLTILDGDVKKSLDLTAAELRNASVVYRRTTPDVHFRLEIFLKGHRTVSETWDLRSSEAAGAVPSGN
jgi:hypothetical protein